MRRMKGSFPWNGIALNEERETVCFLPSYVWKERRAEALGGERESRGEEKGKGWGARKKEGGERK